jgi:hypothetical protein
LYFFPVLVSPTFVEKPSSGEATVGENVSWSCTVHGKPIPEVTWYRDDVPLEDQPKVKVKSNETSRKHQVDSSCKLEDTDLSYDSGEYCVKAENAAGKVTHTFGLTGIS